MTTSSLDRGARLLPLQYGIFHPELQVANGRLAVPDCPGWGVEPDPGWFVAAPGYIRVWMSGSPGQCLLVARRADQDVDGRSLPSHPFVRVEGGVFPANRNCEAVQRDARGMDSSP
jgi:hypothetical protein